MISLLCARQTRSQLPSVQKSESRLAVVDVRHFSQYPCISLNIYIVIMAVTSGVSFVLSSIMTVLLFSGMQMYRGWFTSSQLHTVLGGYLGSVLFVLVLTAIGNLEATLFGKSFQSKLFPEVAGSLFVAMLASGMVHRVSTTTCFLFSLVALYYINQISQQVYSTGPVAQPASFQTKKRK